MSTAHSSVIQRLKSLLGAIGVSFSGGAGPSTPRENTDSDYFSPKPNGSGTLDQAIDEIARWLHLRKSEASRKSDAAARAESVEGREAIERANEIRRRLREKRDRQAGLWEHGLQLEAAATRPLAKEDAEGASFFASSTGGEALQPEAAG